MDALDIKSFTSNEKGVDKKVDSQNPEKHRIDHYEPNIKRPRQPRKQHPKRSSSVKYLADGRYKAVKPPKGEDPYPSFDHNKWVMMRRPREQKLFEYIIRRTLGTGDEAPYEPIVSFANGQHYRHAERKAFMENHK